MAVTSSSSVEIPEILKQANRFKATPAKVVPMRVREHLRRYRRCALAVSLGSKNSEGAHFEGVVRWISENFDYGAILVADTIYRHTLKLTKGVDATREEAIEEGRRFIELQRPIVDTFANGKCKLEWLPFSEVDQSPEFARLHVELQSLFETDEPFRRTVNSFAEVYLGRGDQASNAAVYAEKQRLANRYLLEESAVFGAMVTRDVPLLVYPGSIKSFEDIIEGAHPNVPKELMQMVFVGMRLKRGGPHFLPPAQKEGEQEPEAHALLAGLPEDGWAKLTMHAESERLSSGATVVRHGETERAMYILTEGRMEITSAKGERIAQIEAGSVFGEQAFVDASPRSASVKAMTDCAVLRLTQEGFARLQENEPKIAFALLLDIARVLSERLRTR